MRQAKEKMQVNSFLLISEFLFLQINNELIKIREKKLELLQPELKKDSVKVTAKSEAPHK